MTLPEAVKCYMECQYPEIPCKPKCPLNKPIREWSEHPTFCEVLTEVQQHLENKVVCQPRSG